MADRRGIIVPLLIIAFIILAPEPRRLPAEQFTNRPTIEDAIAQEQAALSTLQGTIWDADFGRNGHRMNVTGLTDENDFVWDALPEVKARAQEHVISLYRDSSGPDAELQWNLEHLLYQNVTGYVRGQWARAAIQQGIHPPVLNLSAYTPTEARLSGGDGNSFNRNVTGREGEISIRLKERPLSDEHWTSSRNITAMHAALKVVDSSEWEAQLYGAYFIDQGLAVLTTTSLKFAGIFALPRFSLDEGQFGAAKELLNRTIPKTIRKQEDGEIEAHNPWSSRGDGAVDEHLAVPSCDLIVWLRQLEPGTSPLHSSSPLVALVEKELRFPTGAFMPEVPDIRFSMLAFSPDCGYVIESGGPPTAVFQETHGLRGPKMEMQYRHGRRHLTIYNIVQALQLWLFMRQMNEASTPSTRSKISLYSISVFALGDGFSTMTFVSLSLFLPSLWTNLAGTGFISFISVSFFGLKFLINIWASQAPERLRSARAEIEEEQRREAALAANMTRLREERLARLVTNAQQASGITTTATADPPTAAPNRPTITATAPVDTGATPVFYMPSDQQGLLPTQQPGTAPGEPSQAVVEARIPTFGSLYTRFYLLLLATAFLSLNAITWSKTPRRIYFAVLSFTYLSFWCPQILRNVQRNCRHALNWEFVLGQSILRLAPFAYFYAYEHNILFADVNRVTLTVLVLWVWLQILVLGSQELIGPRWFIRNEWAPPAYDYHPVLREDEEGATMPIGAAPATMSANDTAPSSPTLERPGSLRRASSAKDVKTAKGRRVFDCAICMQELEIPVVESGASRADPTSLAGGLLARRMYMVTPCRHIFHSGCLEGWMKFRLQCPICREELPPL